MSSTAIDKLAEQYSAIILEKMESMQDNWEKPWTNPQSAQSLPCNIRGTRYRGGNSFMLFIAAELKNYPYPVWLTYKQADSLGCKVNKGEKSRMVESLIKWAVNKITKKIISEKEYRELEPIEQDEYKVMSKVSYYNVFNISQTSLKVDCPKAWEKIENKYKEEPMVEFAATAYCKQLDNMIAEQSWDCKINEVISAQAYYSPLHEQITVPLRTQFKTSEHFYGTLLHEMAHSTLGTGMNRERKTPPGIDPYAHEELIAELSSAITSNVIGLTRQPSPENIQYLKSWMGAIKQDPHYIYNCLSEVKKITAYMSNRLSITPTVDQELIPLPKVEKEAEKNKKKITKQRKLRKI